MERVVSDVQSEKALSQTSLSEFGRTTLLMLVSENAFYPILISELGKLRLVNEVHFWNALCSMDFNELPSVISVNPVQDSKAPPSIIVTEFGIVT